MAERIELTEDDEKAAELASVLNEPSVSIELDVNRAQHFYSRTKVIKISEDGISRVCGAEFGHDRREIWGKEEGRLTVITEKGEMVVSSSRFFDFTDLFFAQVVEVN